MLSSSISKILPHTISFVEIATDILTIIARSNSTYAIPLRTNPNAKPASVFSTPNVLFNST